MAAPKAEKLEFTHQDWSAVVARTKGLVAAGRGWVNLYPEVHDEEGLARPSSPAIGLGAMFRTNGPTIPTATWVMATGKEPATIGLEHGLRTKVLAQLREHGIAPPEGSFRLQDNARRGLVLRLPADVAVEDVLGWLMEAVDDLCPLQLTGNWQAEVHGG